MRRTAILIAILTAVSAAALLTRSNASAQSAPATQPGPCRARYTGPGAKPPERWDDIFWENDRIAHRIYGPAVSQPAPAGEGLVTSGIDVWVKRVRTPFMDKQLMTGAQHDDTTGEGRDCYDVQATCGAGGLGIWDDVAKKLYRSANWADKGGFVTGGNVASFWVTYDPWSVPTNRKVKEKRTFTLPAGTNFTRMVSTIEDASPFVNDAGSELLVGIGIAKRKVDNTRFKGEDKFVADKEKGIMIYWEPDQEYRTPLKAGNTGVAVIVDPKSIVKFVEDKNAAGDVIQNLVIIRVTPGKPWVYYMGACWSLGLDFKTQPEWEKYTRDFKPDFDAAK